MKIVRFDKPYPKQVLFFKSKSKYTMYGGARAGGKSWAGRTKAILLCLRYEGIQVLFVRRTMPELRENHLIPAMRILKDVAKYNGTEKVFSFPNGARLVFGYCATDADLTQYQGQAYDVIFLEEATQFPEKVFSTLSESNRRSAFMKESFKSRMYLTCNPGGVGHAWVKRLFVDKKYKDSEKPEDYTFIKATMEDNRYIMENDPDYVQTLRNLPEDRKRAMLYGDWNVFEGQYFPEFNAEKHTCKAFPIPQSWRRYRVFDYGFDMFAAYFIAMDEMGQHAYAYREVYDGKDLGETGHNGLIASDAAKLLTKRTDPNEKIFVTIAPPDMWNRQKDTGRSTADIFEAEGIWLYKASNERVHGWLEMKEWLKIQPDGLPKLIIFKECRHLIESLPLVLHDEKNPDDVAKEPHEYTHAPDAIRYFCAAQPTAAPQQEPEDEEGGTSFWEYGR